MDTFTRLERLEAESKEIGFYWPDHYGALKQIIEEIAEIKEALEKANVDQAHLQEELGDLLHAVCSLIFFCKFGVQNTLDKALDKYEHRFYSMIDVANKQGVEDFGSLTLDQMMNYWKIAKSIDKK